MQKIIMILLVFGITNSYGQSRGEPVKSLTVEEANKLNGVANPTINGIPYSQYKTQQEALKQKQEALEQKQVAERAASKNQQVEEKTMNVADMKPVVQQKPAVTTTPVVTKEKEVKTAAVPASAASAIRAVSVSVDDINADKKTKPAKAERTQPSGKN